VSDTGARVNPVNALAANRGVTLDLEIPATALAIGAHPDDIEFGCGATLAKWATAGTHIHHLVPDRRAKGSWDPSIDPAALIELRQREQRSAATLLGGGDVEFLGYPDGELHNDTTVQWRVAQGHTYRAPRRGARHDPWRRYRLHPDHRHAGFITTDAIVAARDPHFFPDQFLTPHRPRAVLLWKPTSPIMSKTSRASRNQDRALMATSPSTRAPWGSIRGARQHRRPLPRACANNSPSTVRWLDAAKERASTSSPTPKSTRCIVRTAHESTIAKSGAEAPTPLVPKGTYCLAPLGCLSGRSTLDGALGRSPLHRPLGGALRRLLGRRPLHRLFGVRLAAFLAGARLTAFLVVRFAAFLAGARFTAFLVVRLAAFLAGARLTAFLVVRFAAFLAGARFTAFLVVRLAAFLAGARLTARFVVRFAAFLAGARLAAFLAVVRLTAFFCWSPLYGLLGRGPSLRGYCHRCTSLGAWSLNRGEACATPIWVPYPRAHCRTDFSCNEAKGTHGVGSTCSPSAPFRSDNPNHDR